MHELNSTDRLWYSIGGAFALLIVVGLAYGSIGKVHPHKDVSDRFKLADEALSEGMKAIEDANSVKSKVDTMVNQSMKEFHDR